MRHTPQIQPDRALSEGSDFGFVALDSRLEPENLQPGFVQDAWNMRFTRGRAETRPGSWQPPGFNPDGRGAFIGAGIFSDPVSGVEYLLAAEASKVWFLADGRAPQSVPVKAGYEIDPDAGCEIVQAFSTAILFRGAGEPLYYTDGMDEFEPVSLSVNPSPGDYTAPIPSAEFGVAFANRLWVPNGRDSYAASDILDFTRYDPILSEYRANEGEDDKIVALHPFRDTTLLVFKEQSIYALNNVVGDLSGVYSEVLTKDTGCVARRSVASVGGDVYFLAEGGIYRLSESVDSARVTQAVPVSLPIENLLERINWRQAHRASAAVVDRFYYLAVPIDGSEAPNALLVYDAAVGAWQGVDTFGPPRQANLSRELEGTWVWMEGPDHGGALDATSMPDEYPEIDCLRLLKTDLHGKKRLFIADRRRIIGYGVGRYDFIDGAQRGIHSGVITRAYDFGGLGTKTARAARLHYATRAAALTVSSVTDGVNEASPLKAALVRNRLHYSTFDKADWDPSNAGDDFAAPKRDDYAWIAGDGCQPQSGISLDLHQEFFEGFPLRRRCRSAALKVESSTGSFALLACGADALGSGRGMRKFS